MCARKCQVPRKRCSCPLSPKTPKKISPQEYTSFKIGNCNVIFQLSTVNSLRKCTLVYIAIKKCILYLILMYIPTESIKKSKTVESSVYTWGLYLASDKIYGRMPFLSPTPTAAEEHWPFLDKKIHWQKQTIHKNENTKQWVYLIFTEHRTHSTWHQSSISYRKVWIQWLQWGVDLHEEAVFLC